MKVENTQLYELIFSISKHPFLGAIIEPYVVAYTPIKTLSLTYQKVFSGNASFYTKLNEEQLKWISFLDEIRPESIIKRFSKEKKIRPKEYFKKYFDKELFNAEIRPFIDTKIARLIKAMPYNFNQLYLADDINPAFQKIKINKGFTKILFHLRRNENGTNYFVTLKHDNERVPFMKLGGLMPSLNPAILVVNGNLYRFYDFVDGTKLSVFLNKKYVRISKDQEEKYYSTFVKTLLETAPVFAEGFSIEEEMHSANPILKIGTYKNAYALKLYFKYGENEFAYNNKKNFHVIYKFEDGNPSFIKIKRSYNLENNQVDALKALGLQFEDQNTYILINENDLYSIVQWLTENRDVLELASFSILSELNEKFNLNKPKINYKITEKTDWFDLHVVITVGEFKFPFSKLTRFIKQGERQYILPDGSVFLIPEEWMSLANALSKASVKNGVYSVDKYQLDILNHVKSTKIKKHLNSLVDIKPEKPHSKFKGKLRAYQLDGLSWLTFLKNNRFGGILADDMGLGKTVQTLAHIQKLVYDKSEDDGPILLVAPTSLLFNWKNEAEKFTPDIDVHIHSGNRRITEANELLNKCLIITSYGVVRNDFELLSEINFKLIVLDESQNIKNKTAKTSNLIYKLSAKYKLALTGTPIENSINDLWSQMHFLNKNLLGNSRQFEEHFVKPIEKDADQEKSDNLQSLIKPFVLRRTKDEVAKELPDITEKVIYCEMTEKQKELYEETKSAYRNSILNLVEEQGLAKSKLNVLQGLTKLRQIANHPQLVESEEVIGSGKHNTLLEHLETAIAEGHKMLVFSQFVNYLNILSSDLKKKNIEHFTLTGSTTKEKRNKLVHDFQNTNDVSVFLISLKAGGTGLNLTSADYVFIVDPWWNPAAEAQARDRTHRIGQLAKVFSYKFISRDTIEEKIMDLQRRKKKYSKDIILSENNILKNLDTSTIQNLFD